MTTIRITAGTVGHELTQADLRPDDVFYTQTKHKQLADDESKFIQHTGIQWIERELPDLPKEPGLYAGVAGAVFHLSSSDRWTWVYVDGTLATFGRTDKDMIRELPLTRLVPATKSQQVMDDIVGMASEWDGNASYRGSTVALLDIEEVAKRHDLEFEHPVFD